MEKTLHLGIIPDGNRRWARARGLLPWEGHRAAVEHFRGIADWCREHPRIGTLTIWGFSTENWKRSEREVKELMRLFEQFMQDEQPRLVEHTTRFLHAGRKDRIPPSLSQIFRETEEQTKNFAAFTLQLAIDYGGRDEIVRAVRKMGPKEDIDEEAVRRNLDHPDMPELDLVIRTSGEMRTSNFFLWQSAYAEWMFLEKHFPDLTTDDIAAALDEYDGVSAASVSSLAGPPVQSVSWLSMDKEIFLFRHGDIEGPQDVCKGNALDLPLSPDGEKQTAENIRLLLQTAGRRSAQLFVSPLLRCSAALRHLPRGRHGESLDDLRDIDIGALEGLAYADVERLHPGLLAQLRTDARVLDRLPGAEETIEQFRARTRRAWSRALACPAAVVGLVTHGCVVEEMSAFLRGGNGAVRYLSHPHGSATIVHVHDGHAEIKGERKTLYNGDSSILWDIYPDIFSPSQALRA